MLFGKKKNLTLKIGGMHCVKCVAKVEAALKALGAKAAIDLKLGRAVVTCPDKLDVAELKKAVEALGFSCDIIG